MWTTIQGWYIWFSASLTPINNKPSGKLSGGSVSLDMRFILKALRFAGNKHLIKLLETGILGLFDPLHNSVSVYYNIQQHY